MAKETKDSGFVPPPAHIRLDAKAFAALGGQVVGGASSVLELKEGEGAGPLTCLGMRKDVDLGNGLQKVDMYEARDEQSGDTFRMPIATNFRKNAEMADLQRGDTFAVLRLPDQVKKAGAGKGKPMEMYQITVIKQAPRQAPAAA